MIYLFNALFKKKKKTCKINSTKINTFSLPYTIKFLRVQYLLCNITMCAKRSCTQYSFSYFQNSIRKFIILELANYIQFFSEKTVSQSVSQKFYCLPVANVETFVRYCVYRGRKIGQASKFTRSQRESDQVNLPKPEKTEIRKLNQGCVKCILALISSWK